MNLETMSLISIVALTGIIHTLMGPDHYLPFIALAKARSWSRKTTLWVTSLCGIGHILSSAVIVYLALGLRLSLKSLHVINSYRSDFAAWALIALGCAYFIWGVKKLYKEKNQHNSFSMNKKSHFVLWGLFVAFVVGPCEPLFFLMTYPALSLNPLTVMLLAGVFSVTTVITMTGVVFGASFGLNFSIGKKAMRFAPALAGIIIMCCGIGIKFLGL